MRLLLGKGRELPFLLLFCLYVTICVSFQFLTFDLTKDDPRMWSAAQKISREFPPAIGDLRDYPQLVTPFTLMIFGYSGVVAGRWINFLLSFFIVAGVLVSGRWRAAVGILVFPYFLLIATHLYTDMIAAGLGLLGLVLYHKKFYALSFLAFVFAIASRQYQMATPLALFLWEIRKPKQFRKWLSPMSAFLSLGLWFLFFGGFGPPSEITTQAVFTANPSAFFFSQGLHFLSVIGFYFVVVEAVLNGGFFVFPTHFRPVIGALVLLGIGFLFFPPLENTAYLLPVSMGVLDRGFRAIFHLDAIRLTFYFVFAFLTLMRFADEPFLLLLIFCNALVLTKAHCAWEKYALTALIQLWYFAKPVWRQSSVTALTAPLGVFSIE